MYDILWVLDSNVNVTPGTLGRGVDALNRHGKASPERRVGLVHHVPYAIAAGSQLGSRLEHAFINTNHAKMYVGLNTLAIDSCVMGKSNMFRRSDLDLVIGGTKKRGPHADPAVAHGLPAFAKYLAEDAVIGSALWHELGLRHDLSCDVAPNVLGNMTLSDYVQRRVRWVRLRKRVVLAATLLEPFTESVLLGSIAAWALAILFGLPCWLSLSLHEVATLLVDLDIYTSLAGHPIPAGSRWCFITVWMVREILALPIWLLAMVGNSVEWRGQTYRIIRKGEAEVARL